jgi:hypothetical protein
MNPYEIVGVVTLAILNLSWTAQYAWNTLSPWAMVIYFIRPNSVGLFIENGLPKLLRVLSPLGTVLWLYLFAIGSPNGGIGLFAIAYAGTIGTVFYIHHMVYRYG